jgi:hypothetical protein
MRGGRRSDCGPSAVSDGSGSGKCRFGQHLCCNAGGEPNAPVTRFLLIAASILAAGKLAEWDGGKGVPATIAAISDAVRWAERIDNGGD